MKNLKIKYAAAYNFLPFGSDGIELHFENYKNVVLIRGVNLDSKSNDSKHHVEDNRSCSNGAGKSSIQEIITYALLS